MKRFILQWHSLKTRITVATLCIFLAGIWSLSFYVSQMLREDIERLLTEQQLSTVSVLATQVNRELETRTEALKTVAGISASALLEGSPSLQAFLEQTPYLQSFFNGGVFAIDADGVALAAVPMAAERIGVNYMDRDYAIAALREGRASISRPVTGRTLHAPVFVMATPIHDPQGKVIGALAGVVNLGAPNFLDQITQNHYGKALFAKAVE